MPKRTVLIGCFLIVSLSLIPHLKHSRRVTFRRFKLYSIAGCASSATCCVPCFHSLVCHKLYSHVIGECPIFLQVLNMSKSASACHPERWLAPAALACFSMLHEKRAKRIFHATYLI